MTREEAIGILTMLICQDTRIEADDYEQALEMAIQALNSLEEVYAKGYNDGFMQAEVNYENDKALSQEPCPYSTKDGYCQYDDIAKIIPTEQEPCEVSEYDKDHIWYKGNQYISLRRFLEVKAEAEKEPTTTTNNNEPMTIIYPTIVCDDAISREAVIAKIRDEYKGYMQSENYAPIDFVNIIENLPSVSTTKNIVNHGTMNITL